MACIGGSAHPGPTCFLLTNVHLMINKIFGYFKELSRKEHTNYNSRLAKLAKEFKRLKQPENSRLRILYGPSFSIYPPVMNSRLDADGRD